MIKDDFIAKGQSFRIHVSNDFFGLPALYMYRKEPNNRMSVVTALEMQTSEVGTTSNAQSIPVKREDLVSFMNDLWNMGIRPDVFTSPDGQIAAQRQHIDSLENMLVVQTTQVARTHNMIETLLRKKS